MEKLLVRKLDIPFFTNGADLFSFALNGGYCAAIVVRGIDKDGKWATVYHIVTNPKHRYKKECQKLLKELKETFDKEDVRFGVWCPMNDIISNICDKLEIKTYEEDEC